MELAKGELGSARVQARSSGYVHRRSDTVHRFKRSSWARIISLRARDSRRDYSVLT